MFSSIRYYTDDDGRWRSTLVLPAQLDRCPSLQEERSRPPYSSFSPTHPTHAAPARSHCDLHHETQRKLMNSIFSRRSHACFHQQPHSSSPRHSTCICMTAPLPTPWVQVVEPLVPRPLPIGHLPCSSPLFFIHLPLPYPPHSHGSLGCLDPAATRNTRRRAQSGDQNISANEKNKGRKNKQDKQDKSVRDATFGEMHVQWKVRTAR